MVHIKKILKKKNYSADVAVKLVSVVSGFHQRQGKCNYLNKPQGWRNRVLYAGICGNQWLIDHLK